MKLIISEIELENEFQRLLNSYNKFYWATAWAGINQNLCKTLRLNSNKIKKIVVGIHFFQTHPNFIEMFRKNLRVRFMLQPEGTYHPKLYLFYNDQNSWELIIGSANFTNAAFTINTEATLLINSKQNNSRQVLKKALILVNRNWNDAVRMSKSDLDKYRLTWQNMRKKIDSLSGKYSGKMNKNPKQGVQIINKTWADYIKEVKSEKTHGLRKRLKVIEISRNCFKKSNHFSNLNLEERKFIAGYPNILNVEGSDNWGFFGSMRGRGDFAHEIIINNKIISKALDQIPLIGQITKSHYDNFVKYFKQIFKGNFISSATRLLSMKRPDTFICFNAKNRSGICKDFGIIQSGLDYERYWDDIILRIYDSEWWLNPKPKSKNEELICEARAAFLDSLYYIPKVEFKSNINHYWLKPEGVTGFPIKEGTLYASNKKSLHFSDRKPKGVKINDTLIVYGVGTTKILSIFKCISFPNYASKSQISKTPWKKRWPWYVEAKNLSRIFGAKWWHYDFQINKLKDKFLAKFPNENITFAGSKSLGSLNYGNDKVKLSPKFAKFIIAEIQRQNKQLIH